MTEVWVKTQDKSLEAHSPLLSLETIYDSENLGFIQAAEREGSLPLSGFISMNAEDMALIEEQFGLSAEDKAALIEEFNLDPEQLEVPRETEQWFDPADGLKTVQALLRHAATFSEGFETPNIELKWIVRDLQQLEQFLKRVLAVQTGFYISTGPG